MTKRLLLALLIGIVSIGLTVSAAGTLHGRSWLDVTLDPDVGFTGMDYGLELAYTVGGFAFSTDSLFVLPGSWVWQGFTAVGQLGGFSAHASALLGGDIAKSLYAETIMTFSMAGIDFAFHAAQLSEHVHGGAADGAAIRAAGSVGAFGIVSVTEFGAQIEDDDFGGITIVHAATGRERHYATDPRVVGEGFTGQKFTINHFNFCCAEEITFTAYITCAGFDYASFGVEDLLIGNLPWLTLDAELKFELEAKSLLVTPKLVLGDIACFELYAALDNAANVLSIEGINLQGISLECQIGPVTVRDVSLFAPCDLALTTERHGSQVLPIVDILAQGMDYYPDYFEMFSIAYAGPACCEGEYNFLVNVYFDEDSTSLFDWAMTHVETMLPYGESLAFTFGMEVTADGLEYLGFGFEITW
ncbi:hypothetical protein KAH43_03850 [Candidatus Bipolaricaulota bacterium]|nr:hypothetical protein [Candidatus Bipolaricaulota bacterium]